MERDKGTEEHGEKRQMERGTGARLKRDGGEKQRDKMIKGKKQGNRGT